ncbi:SDC3 protein, partial [Cercotrichas coryphoeus]|nr:SDC3 protein [Cercotrichas coryphoeus]
LGSRLSGAGAAHVPLPVRSQAQRWRNENYERPVDLEGSGDDDPFGEDELDDVYSGSGSGYFEPELGLDTAVSLTTDTLVTLPTTAAVLPVTAAQPVATPLEPSPSPQDSTPGQATSAFLVPRTTEAPVEKLQGTGPGMETENGPAQPWWPQPLGDHRVVGLCCHCGTTSVTQGRDTLTLSPCSPPCPWSGDILPVDTLWSLSPAPSCPFSQMEPGEVTTVPDSELEVPASSGPSGDFEIREEEETTRPELGNEVVAVVTPPAGRGPGRNAETGLMDNTIDSGNSAAQLPQKNILERKEVLIGEIRG